VREIAQQLAAGDTRIIGVMVESHLTAGRQDLVPGKPLAYGQSVTDACIGWDDRCACWKRWPRRAPAALKSAGYAGK